MSPFLDTLKRNSNRLPAARLLYRVRDLFEARFRRRKRAEILLVTTPPWGIHNPPVGLGYLSTYLRANGIATEVFDFNIGLYRRIHHRYHKLWRPEYKNWWSRPELYPRLSEMFAADIQWAAERIVEIDAPVVGFSVVDPKERITIETIRKVLARRPDKRIILGGPAVSTPQQQRIFLDNLGGRIDFIVQHEGEKMLLEIMRNYRRGRVECPDPAGSKPCIVQKDIPDLSELPHPTYDEFDFSMYDGGSLIVEWSRGCISSCAYCKGRKVQGNFRMKKAATIVGEIEYQHRRNRMNYFVVCDNLLNGNIRELERVCDLLIAKDLPVQWEGQAIPYRRMTAGLLEKMRAAGCVKLQWGLESGSDRVLKNVRKGRLFTVTEAQEVIRACHGAGIRTELFIIIGLPGEDADEFAKTRDFIVRNQESIDMIKSINTLHLVHGTDLYDRAGAYDLVLPEVHDYYLWRSADGVNTYPRRVANARELLSTAADLGIKVQEHNLFEGQENDLTL